MYAQAVPFPGVCSILDLQTQPAFLQRASESTWEPTSLHVSVSEAASSPDTTFQPLTSGPCVHTLGLWGLHSGPHRYGGLSLLSGHVTQPDCGVTCVSSLWSCQEEGRAARAGPGGGGPLLCRFSSSQSFHSDEGPADLQHTWVFSAKLYRLRLASHSLALDTTQGSHISTSQRFYYRIFSSKAIFPENPL